MFLMCIQFLGGMDNISWKTSRGEAEKVDSLMFAAGISRL